MAISINTATDGLTGSVNWNGTPIVTIDGNGATIPNLTGNVVSGNDSRLSDARQVTATQLINTITGKQASMNMLVSDSTNNGSFVCRATGTSDANLAGMTFWNDAYAIKLGVRADGYFGLGGWSRAAWSWYSDVNGNMVAAGNVTAYSDPRLKDNVRKIVKPFEILSKLDGVRFNWNRRSKLTEGKWDKEDVGILADQVKSVLPEIVTASIVDESNNETYDTVDYSKLVPVLIEAIKELKEEIDILKGVK